MWRMRAGSNTAPDTESPHTPLGLAFFSLAVGIPCFALLDTKQPQPFGLTALTLCILIYSAARLSFILARRKPEIVTGVVFIFFYVAMAVVPLAQAQTGIYPHLHSRSYLAQSQMLALLAAIAFDMPRFIRIGPKKSISGTPWVLSHSRLLILTAFSLLASANLVRSLGGISPFFASRQEQGEAFEAAGLAGGSEVSRAFVSTLGTTPVLIVFMCWLLLVLRQKAPIRLGQAAILILLGVVNLIVNNFISSSRYWFLTIVIALVFMLPKFSIKKFQATIVGGILVAVVLFPYSDYFRVAAESRTSTTFVSIAEKISTKDFDQSVMVANGIWYVDAHGHSFGYQLLGVLLFWLPRSVWSGKPLDTGVLIGQQLSDAGTTNLSSPMFLEFWMDFGTVGMVVLMGLVGYASIRAQRAFMNSLDAQRSSVLITDIILPLIAGFMFILLRGPLLQATGRMAVIAVCCLFLAAPKGRLGRTRRKTASTPPALVNEMSQ